MNEEILFQPILRPLLPEEATEIANQLASVAGQPNSVDGAPHPFDSDPLGFLPGGMAGRLGYSLSFVRDRHRVWVKPGFGMNSHGEWGHSIRFGVNFGSHKYGIPYENDFGIEYHLKLDVGGIRLSREAGIIAGERYSLNKVEFI